MRTVFFQLISTFVALITVYLVYAVFEPVEADTLQVSNFLFFQPLNAIIVSAVSIAGCFIAGLPLRLNEKINQWWMQKPLFALLGIATGIVFLYLAFNPNLTQTKQMILNGEPSNYEAPNALVSIAGWFLLAFSLLHFYPSSLQRFFRR